jgi:hypothetical protein
VENRQVARSRRLTPEAHDQLVASLSDMDSIELHVPQMELMSPREQMELVSKADILLGVHGNGLTNELWLKPGGAVIESAHAAGSARSLSFLTDQSRFPFSSRQSWIPAASRRTTKSCARPFLGSASLCDATSRRLWLIAPPSCFPPQLTEPLNHSYYPIWHDKVYDWKAGRVGMHVLETFHGIAITVSAPFIRSLIETLLATNAVEPNRPAQ